MSQYSLTRFLVDGTEIEGEVGARIQAALDKFDKERRRRLFIDGEVITMNGRVVDPDRVSDTIRDRGD